MWGPIPASGGYSPCSAHIYLFDLYRTMMFLPFTFCTIPVITTAHEPLSVHQSHRNFDASASNLENQLYKVYRGRMVGGSFRASLCDHRHSSPDATTTTILCGRPWRSEASRPPRNPVESNVDLSAKATVFSDLEKHTMNDLATVAMMRNTALMNHEVDSIEEGPVTICNLSWRCGRPVADKETATA